MELKIERWNKGAAIRLPRELLKEMGLVTGDSLSVVSLTSDAIILKPSKTKPRYRLADLVAQCDLSAPEPAELEAWRDMKPTGYER